jgi:hypothetical protein
VSEDLTAALDTILRRAARREPAAADEENTEHADLDNLLRRAVRRDSKEQP